MKSFLVFSFLLGSTLAYAAQGDQRVEIQPGGWVRIDPQVTTIVTCVGTPNEVTKLCRCDYDTDMKYRAELVMITNGTNEKVVALTPYYYPTYESCINQLPNMNPCK